MFRKNLCILVLFCLIFASCGSNQDEFIFTNQGGGGHASPGVTARFVFDIGQAVVGRIPDSALTFRLRFFDPLDDLVREVVEPRTEEVIVTGLPAVQLRVRIEFLDGGGQIIGYIDRFLDPQAPDESTTLIIDVLLAGPPPALPPFPDSSTAGVLTNLAFSQLPASVQVGTDFSVQVVALDGFNLLVPSESSPVSVTAASGGTVTGGNSINFVNGLANFPGLTVVGPGPLVLRATSGALLANSLPLPVAQQPGFFLQAARAYPLNGDRHALTIDLNGDAFPDLLSYGLNRSDPTLTTQALQVSLNRGDGTFELPNYTEIPGTGGGQINSADFDGDGDNDIGVAISVTTPQVLILLNNGDGTFAAPVAVPGLSTQLIGLVFDDLNGDQIPDLITTLTFTSEVAVALGNGDGTFGTINTFDSSSVGLALYTADFDDDNQRDVLLQSAAGSEAVVLFGNGDGSLQSPTTVVLPGATSGLAVGDFNKDQNDDFLAGIGQTAVFVPSNGDGTFGAVQTVSFPAPVVSVKAVDFNGDTNPDVLVGMSNAQSSVGVALGNGNGTFGSVTTFPGEGSCRSIDGADLNSDTRLDIVQGGAFGTTVFMQDSQGGIDQTSLTLVAGRRATDVVSGDFNEDGHIDLAATNDLDRLVTIYIGDGSGGFSAGTDFGTLSLAVTMAVGDLDGDNHLDLAFGSAIDNSIGVIFGGGDGTFGSGITLTPGSGANEVSIADMDNDNELDVISTNTSDGSLSVFRHSTNRQFSPPITTPVAPLMTRSEIGDVNGDNNLDVVSINDSGQSYTVSLGNGSGGFSGTSEVSLGARALSLAMADLDGDGELDLALAVGPELRTLLGNGDGTFGTGSSQPAFLIGFGIRIGDLNGDAVPDVVAAGDYVTTFVGNGDGSLQEPVSYFAGDQPRGISLADLNEDGRLDVVVTNLVAELVQVLLNLRV
jgi:FG-GAP-like repeat